MLSPPHTYALFLAEDRQEWLAEHAEEIKSLPAIVTIKLPQTPGSSRRRLALAMHGNIHVSLLEEDGRPNQYFQDHPDWDAATKVSYLNHVLQAEIACYLDMEVSFTAEDRVRRCAAFTTAAGLMDRFTSEGELDEDAQPADLPYPHILWNRMIEPKTFAAECNKHKRMLQILKADLVVAGHTAHSKVERFCDETFFQTDVGQSRFMKENLRAGTVSVLRFGKKQEEPSVLSQRPSRGN